MTNHCALYYVASYKLHHFKVVSRNAIYIGYIGSFYQLLY